MRSDVRTSILLFARTGRAFCADDVADNLDGAVPEGIMASEFARAHRIGLIRRISTTDSRRHASLLRTWRGSARSLCGATVV